MRAKAAGESPRKIDFRVAGEGREYLKKLAIPAIIVLLLLVIFAYLLITSGPEYFLARLMASSFFVLAMLIGAVILFILLRIYMRMRFFYHVISYSVRASERNLPGIHETMAQSLKTRRRRSTTRSSISFRSISLISPGFCRLMASG